MKYALIDSNNLACRSAFSQSELTTSEGLSSGAVYGTINSLCTLKRKFPEHQFLMAWDSKSKRRMEESEKGVWEHIISESYKANRHREEMPKPLKDFYANQAFLQKGIGTLGIPQIIVENFEADDVLGSYAKVLKSDNEVICVTSDKDYYAILDKNVSIYDGMKQEEMTLDSFRATMGIEPKQWTDVGAMMGDDGDNIFSAPGWGIKTALKEIKKYGSWQNLIAAYEKEYGHLRVKYPDMHELDSKSEIDLRKVFDELRVKKSDPEKPTSKLLYPGIYWGMPYSGVLTAYDNDEIKMPKTTLMALVFQERIKLAYSLKKIDDDISPLPAIENGIFDEEKLKQFFAYYEIYSLGDAFELFGGKTVGNTVKSAIENITSIPNVSL